MKRRLKEVGRTHRDLAEALGKDRTVATRILNGRQPLRIPQIPAVARVLRVSAAEVMRRTGFDGAESGQAEPAAQQVEESKDFTRYDLSQGAELAVGSQPVVDVSFTNKEVEADAGDPLPVKVARGGEKDAIVEPEVIDHIPRPPFLRGVRQAYAVYLVGASMEPKYTAGTTLYVHPFKTPKRMNGVVVYLRNGSVLVKQYVRRTAEYYELKEYHPEPRVFTIPLAEVVEMHTVTGTEEP